MKIRSSSPATACVNVHQLFLVTMFQYLLLRDGQSGEIWI